MSCTAMANATWPSRCLSVFCGTLKAGPKLAASCTSGKSAAGKVSSENRLLPPLRRSLSWLDSRLTVWSPGMVRSTSMTLRAFTVVVKSPVSPPSSAVVRICTSRSLVVNCSALPVLRISTLARMGSVWRRSTMPATDCRTARTLSCVAFRTIMSTSGVFGYGARSGGCILPSSRRTSCHFALCRAAFGCCAAPHGSALEGLLQHVQLLVQFGELLALARNLAHRVQHGGVVAPAEQLANLGQALLRQLLGQVHGNLARPGNAGRALLAVHVGDLDLVVVGHRLLDVFHADLPVLDRKQIAQRLARELDGDVLLVEAAVGQDLA